MVWTRSLFVCLLWAALTLAQAPVQAPLPANAPQFVLPDDVVPKSYQIELTIDPRKDTFQGLARIELEVLKPAEVIWLNATGLTVQEATVQMGGAARAVRSLPAGDEFLALQLGEAARPGRALVSIRYQGSLSDKASVGPYRVNYENEWYVFTSFTAIEARRAFPCFDEPRFKTPWEFTIRIPREDRAFANAKEVRTTDEPGGMKAVHFARTSPLPSEVIAFAVGPLERLDGGRAGGRRVPVGVVTPKGHTAEGEEAVRVTADVLKRLEAYTGMPYPYEKLDHAAAPRFPFGATENPGLIVYSQRSLLIPASTPADQLAGRKASVRSIMTHETAHQWFGDLVTPDTWQDVYLSEGFATWLTARVLDEDQPAARKHLAAVAARERIMTADAGPKTRPVRLEMKDRAGMRDVYSQFVYQKAGAVLLMLERWLGEDRFQDALRNYLKDHRFGNATTDDWAAALRKASGTDPSAVMHAFLDQTGIPAIRATIACAPGQTPKIFFEQTNTSAQWTVPVCWKADGGAASCDVLERANRQIPIRNTTAALTACPAWIFTNSRGTGYYRSEWTREQLDTLSNRALAQLTAAERLTLLYDLRAQQRAGKLDAASLKPILSKLASDPEPEIARAATDLLAPPKQ